MNLRNNYEKNVAANGNRISGWGANAEPWETWRAERRAIQILSSGPVRASRMFANFRNVLDF